MNIQHVATIELDAPCGVAFTDEGTNLPIGAKLYSEEALQIAVAHARKEGMIEALGTADNMRQHIAKKYQQRIDDNESQMGGNMDWARLEGAVQAVSAIRLLISQVE